MGGSVPNRGSTPRLLPFFGFGKNASTGNIAVDTCGAGIGADQIESSIGFLSNIHLQFSTT